MKDSYGRKLRFGIDCLRNATFHTINDKKKMNKIVEILNISIELILLH